MSLLIQETFVNTTEGHIFGEGPLLETNYDTPGEVFRAMQREYGRCVSHVYHDTTEGTKRNGWVFQKRMQYEDSKDWYIREVWVTVHISKPTITYHRAEV